MRAKVLTLRFSPTLGRFDDAPLVSLQQKVVLEHVREHLVQIGDETMLVCVTTWREQQQQQPATAPILTVAAAAAPVEPALRPTGHNGREPGPARPVGELRADLTDEQRALFDRLRGWRSKTAHDEGMPPYAILTNRQLVELIRQRPDSKAGIARVHGLGDKKVARHGDAILQALWQNGAGTEPTARAPEPATDAEHPSAAAEAEA